MGDLEAGFLGYSLIDLLVYRLVYIKKATASLTPEVIVVVGIAIEPA
jgi:hypothetical protein